VHGESPSATIDVRLGIEWPGDDPENWYLGIEDGPAVRGLRYARNCVHHDWSLAVTLPEERPDRPLRQSVPFWTWVPILPSRRPDPDGEAAYLEHLAGKSAMLTLTGFTVVFAKAVTVLAEHGRSSGNLPFDVGPQPS
jgi:hypothetical protein